MNSIIAVNPEKCVACGNCLASCSLVHEGAFSPARSRITPVQIRKLTMNFPTLCMQCRDPLCMDVCPVTAISRNEETGALIVNVDQCVGCRMCTVVCPLGGISINYENGKAMKCDLCDGDPVCVKACGYGALNYIEAEKDALNKRLKGIEKISKILKKMVE
jgi:anaerobic carbon-monoxide dehydrogenase iron sulfur subunit